MKSEQIKGIESVIPPIEEGRLEVPENTPINLMGERVEALISNVKSKAAQELLRIYAQAICSYVEQSRQLESQKFSSKNSSPAQAINELMAERSSLHDCFINLRDDILKEIKNLEPTINISENFDEALEAIKETSENLRHSLSFNTFERI